MSPRTRHRAAPARAVTLVVAALCAGLAGYLALSARDERTLREANRLGAAGEPAAALRKAAEVTRAPAGTRARLTEAYAALAANRPDVAVRAFAAAARRDRENWVVHRDWALALVRAGHVERGRRRMARAVALNPRMRVPYGFPR